MLATSAEQETLIVKMMLSVVLTLVTEQVPEAPPMTVMSALENPVTDASKVMLNSGVRSESTEAVSDHSAVGIVASRVTEEVVAADVGPLLPT